MKILLATTILLTIFSAAVLTFATQKAPTKKSPILLKENASTNPKIISITKKIAGNIEIVTVNWSDTPLIMERFSFSDGTAFVEEGVGTSKDGSFIEHWTGSPRKIYFVVCNVLGSCAATQAVSQ